MKYYTTKQIADLFNVSNRAIVKRCSKSSVYMKDGRYSISQDVLNKWTIKRNKNNRVPNLVKVPNHRTILDASNEPLSEPNVRSTEPKVIELQAENMLLRSRLEALAKSNVSILKILRTLNNEVARLGMQKSSKVDTKKKTLTNKSPNDALKSYYDINWKRKL